VAGNQNAGWKLEEALLEAQMLLDAQQKKNEEKLEFIFDIYSAMNLGGRDSVLADIEHLKGDCKREVEAF
jgi:hypothetical protein